MFDKKPSLIYFIVAFLAYVGINLGQGQRKKKNGPVLTRYQCNFLIEILYAPLKDKLDETLVYANGRPEMPPEPSVQSDDPPILIAETVADNL